ncbi:MAG: hypothetical protein RIS75_253 [Actinomycetota bacterium]
MVVEHLRSQLLPHEKLFQHVRFSDAQHGDVEADVLIMIPEAGIAVIEIKGGTVEYRDGQWLMIDEDFQRRIHPIDQARRAKHALRKYLDRQPEWQFGLVRSEWFLALPFTQVNADMGPEGRRELLIGKADLTMAMAQIREALNSPENSDPRPTQEMIDMAANLLIRPGSHQVHSTSSWAYRLRSKTAIAVGVALLAVAAFGVGVWRAQGSQANNCDPNYSGCVPVQKDVDCADFTASVTVTGTDIYELDRDGDGKACEWNEPSPSTSS